MSFLLPFAWYFCPPVLPHLSVRMLPPFLFLIVLCGLFAITSVSVCVCSDSIVLSHFHVPVLAWVCVPLFCRFDAWCFAYWVMSIFLYYYYYYCCCYYYCYSTTTNITAAATTTTAATTTPATATTTTTTTTTTATTTTATATTTCTNTTTTAAATITATVTPTTTTSSVTCLAYFCMNCSLVNEMTVDCPAGYIRRLRDRLGIMSINIERFLHRMNCYLVCHSDHFWEYYFSELFIYYLCDTVRYSNCRLFADYIRILCDKVLLDSLLLQSNEYKLCLWMANCWLNKPRRQQDLSYSFCRKPSLLGVDYKLC